MRVVPHADRGGSRSLTYYGRHGVTVACACPILLPHPLPGVQGEAIAFALGGTKRMLRAKSHAALINDAARQEDGATSAQVRWMVSPAGRATCTRSVPGAHAHPVATRVETCVCQTCH